MYRHVGQIPFCEDRVNKSFCYNPHVVKHSKTRLLSHLVLSSLYKSEVLSLYKMEVPFEVFLIVSVKAEITNMSTFKSLKFK